MSNKLTPKQETFVKAYVETQNATEAAVQAYDLTSRATASVMGCENLAKPNIQQAVDSLTHTMREITSSALQLAIESAKEDLKETNTLVKQVARGFLLECVKVYAESTEKTKVSQHLHVKAPTIPKR